MKKHFILILKLVAFTLLFNDELKAQSGDSCTTAISVQNIMNLDDTSILISHNINWYEFQNDSSFIFFEFYKASTSPILGKFYNIQILKGSCSSNTIVFDTTIVHGTNAIIFELANQTSGIYFIKIQNMDTINCPGCIAPYYLGLALKNANYSSIPWPVPTYISCPNLIKNASFETITGTQTCQGISNFLNYWGQSYSPDWYTINNSCPNTNIPTSTWFGTIANPPLPSIVSSNNSYVGMITAMYQNGAWDATVKEKVSQSTPIMYNSKRYIVRAKVALAPGTQYTSNNMNIKVCSQGNMYDNPQISAPMLTTPNQWVQLEGTFVSDGTEDRIIIGNNSNSNGGNMNTSIVQISTDPSKKPCAYYFADDIEMYRMAYAGPDIVISTCKPKQIGKCAFPNSTYLWSPATGLSSAVNAQPFAMPTQTTQYIVKVTYWLMNGGTVVDYDTVIVTVPPCNCFADAGPDITILDCSPGAIGPDCINSNLTYSWSPSIGLNDPNIANPLALPATNTTYVLTVTYIDQASGYTFTNYDTVQVNINTQVCINNITPHIIYPIIYANNLVSVFNSNTNYAIDGTVYVNIPNFTISNLDLVLGPNTKFVIFPNCQLIISNSYLHGCCAMWHGIKVDQNAAVLITNNSVIEDADTAITVTNNGSYQLDNSIFNKNFIDVAAIGTPLVNQNAIVQRCTFDCNDAQMPGTYSTYGLRIPMSGNRSAIAISANGVSPLTIGSSAADANYFFNHDFGLFIKNVHFTAKYNTFENIDDNSVNTYNFGTPKGINIHLENTTNLTYNSLLEYNTFSKGVTAINAFNGYDGHYLFNVISDMTNFGIVFFENKKRSFRILGNKIDNVGWVGIYGLNNFSTQVGINSNILTNSYNKLFRTAIGVDETSTATSSNVNIAGNSIDNYEYGITATKLSRLKVMSNTINIQPTPWALYSHGVRLLECIRPDVFGNTIYGNNRDEWFVDGIRMDNSNAANLKCNYTVKTGSGAFFVGPAISVGELYSNIFLKDFWGVVLANQAHIGTQGNPTVNESYANQWIGSMGNPDYAHTFAYFADGTQSPFYTTAGYPWQPTVNTAIGGGANFIPVTTGGINLNNNCLLYRESIDTTMVIISPINEPMNETQLLQQINTAQNSNYTASQAWWLKASAYNRLETEDPSTIQNFDLVMFKDSVDSAALGRFANINKMLSDTIIEDIDSLRAANSAVPTNTNMEENIKVVNELTMSRAKYGLLENDKIEQLRIIAALCPFEEGPAVYTARALLRAVDSQREEYMHECEKVYPQSSSNRESESQISKNRANDEIGFNINPNPTKSVITLTQKGDFKLIQISEMSGKIVFERTLNTNENSQTFDLSQLTNGIYMISLVSDFNTVRTKLIINK